MKKKLFLATTALLLLVGCSNEDAASITNQSQELEILVKVADGTKSKAQKVGSAFATNEVIKLATKGDGVYSYKLFPYQYGGATTNKWSAVVETNKLLLKNGPATISGIYPSDVLPQIDDVDTQAFDNWKINVKQASSSMVADDQIDYLWATAKAVDGNPISLANKVVELNFKHVFSRISFVLNKSSQYTSNGKVTKIVIKKSPGFSVGDGLLYAWNNWDATEPLMSWNDPKVEQISCEDANGILLNADPTSTTQIAHIILAPVGVDATHPNGLATGLSIELTVDDKIMVANLPDLIDGNGKSTFLGGYFYQYTIQVAPKGLEVSPEVKMSDWIDKPLGEFDIK